MRTYRCQGEGSERVRKGEARRDIDVISASLLAVFSIRSGSSI